MKESQRIVTYTLTLFDSVNDKWEAQHHYSFGV